MLFQFDEVSTRNGKSIFFCTVRMEWGFSVTSRSKDFHIESTSIVRGSKYKRIFDFPAAKYYIVPISSIQYVYSCSTIMFIMSFASIQKICSSGITYEIILRCPTQLHYFSEQFLQGFQTSRDLVIGLRESLR